MKKMKACTVICLALILSMLIPFGAQAVEYKGEQFVAPDYKEYQAGGESNLEIALDYEPYEWLSINVTDTKTGEVWRSNPTHYKQGSESASTERQKTEQSQLVLVYNYDQNGNRDRLADIGYVSSASKTNTYYSYTDCVVRDQATFEEIVENGKVVGFKVIYGFGDINSEIYPLAMSESSFDRYYEQYCEIAVDEAGNPDEKARKQFASRYAYYQIEALNASMEKEVNRQKTESAKKAKRDEWDLKIQLLLQTYPLLETGEGVYELYSSATATVFKKNQLIADWQNLGFTRDDLAAEYEYIGYTAAASGVNFMIPVIYKIEGNTLKVQVVTSEIEQPSEVAITRLDVLPQFGAMLDTEVEEGYTFIPDGSGAIIEHGNGDIRSTSVQIALSNRHKDEALARDGNKIADIPYFETSVLPVFGMKQDNRALFGIIEKGYEIGNVAAYLAEGKQNQYNYVYPSFYVTATDEIYYSNGSSSGLTMFPKVYSDVEVEVRDGLTTKTEVQEWGYCRLPATDLQIRYTFLYDEEANYVGMAKFFRQYLIDLYGLDRLEVQANTTFYADIYGAILKKIGIAGFPIQVKYALTDFDEATEIVNELLTRVGGLSVRYMGMANGALYATDYSNHFRPLFALGGKKGYRQFLSDMDALGVTVYPDVNPTHVFVDKTFDGFMPYYDAVRTLGRKANIIQSTNVATGLYGSNTFDDERFYFPRWVVSPSQYGETFSELMTALDQYGNKNVSLTQVGSTLSADYDESLIIDRTQTSRVISSILESYQDAGYSVSVEVGNYWALPYVDVIMKAPVTSSRYIIEDYEIPFLQMAIHGMISYTSEEINTVQNAQFQILKCLEYGASLSARLMYEDDIVLQNTYYTTQLYSMDYRNWIDQIGEMYGTVNDVLKNVQDRFIVDHVRLATNVYATTYENGLKVAVNYNNEDVAVSVDGVSATVPGNGFVVLDRGN